MFIPVLDPKGAMTFTGGQWCDDARLVKDCNLNPMDKVILARRVPESAAKRGTSTSQPTTPERDKKKFAPRKQPPPHPPCPTAMRFFSAC